jgi:hypothetical protein
VEGLRTRKGRVAFPSNLIVMRCDDAISSVTGHGVSRNPQPQTRHWIQEIAVIEGSQI